VRYFFRVEYDGTRFGGWQRQPNALSIQELLENAFSIALRSQISVTGAGRTDAGVHAKSQGAHFDFEGEIDLRRCELSINALLPSEVAIYKLQKVDNNFHARFCAVNRRYRYQMCLKKRPLLYKRVWMIYHEIDFEKIRENLHFIKGTHDFAVFCASGSDTESTICKVKNVSLENEGDLIVFTIEADRFIYKMVRSIVGTLIDIGRGKINSTIAEIISCKDRSFAGITAPPFGLVLEQVDYPGVDCETK
jgi:tRNA pseudouridine38-40 synthase